MTDLPELPGQLTPRSVELPFEITPEHVETLTHAVGVAASAEDSAGPEWSTAQGLAEVVKLVWIEHVLPIEQALAESEAQVAELGRRLYAATHGDAQ